MLILKQKNTSLQPRTYGFFLQPSKEVISQSRRGKGRPVSLGMPLPHPPPPAWQWCASPLRFIPSVICFV